MSESLVPVCDVDGCGAGVPGLNDGYEFDRGVVCNECTEYRNRHGHYPDEDRKHCVECSLDDGAVRHDCDETFADSVVVTPGEFCPCCNEVIGS